jgi:Cdc6-like AAA superfamily ATPase
MSDTFGLEHNAQIEKSGVRKVFTPHAPVKLQELLFGRTEALKQIIKQIHTPGAAPILFGDRGVGKTSIASIVQALINHSISDQKNTYVGLKRCSSKETIASIFEKALKHGGIDISLIESTSTQESGGGAGINAGFAKASIGAKRVNTEKHAAANANLSPSKIAELLSSNFEFGLLIVDETDAIADETVKYELAEIAKQLSDSHSTFKIMLVGVAELSSTLTAGHPSIGRCAVETKLDRMTDTAIRQIVTAGALRIKPAMDFDQEVVKHIAQLAGGYLISLT